MWKSAGTIAAAVFAAGMAAGAAAATADQLAFFEKNVRPVLAENCHKCHSHTSKKLKADLYLDSREGMLRGGDNGPAIRPGDPANSRLIEAIGYENVDFQMPPKKRLSAADVKNLTAWVAMGAPWPNERAPTSDRQAAPGIDIAKRMREHWAWKPVERRPLPPVRDRSWSHNPIDLYILAKLESKGMKPAGPADRRTLIRRAFMDLIGLPPTPEEVDAFVIDQSTSAFADVVDRLLASQHFGERWARHWLDLFRYANSRGHEFDFNLPNADRYRDYLIRALNVDVPYNELSIEHIAGDLMESPRLNPEEGFNESILGTGFWWLGEAVHSPVDIRQDEADRFDNMIDVMGQSFLGLTIGCTRCHDHKFDPITQKDYYALMGYLQSSSYRLVRFDSIHHNKKVAAELAALDREFRREYAPAAAKAKRATIEHIVDYLISAREAVQAPRRVDSSAKPSVNVDAGMMRNIAAIARAKGRDKDILKGWVEQLLHAKSDRKHPLHAFGLTLDVDGSSIASVIRPLVAEETKRRERYAADREQAEIIIDYQTASARDFMQDGYSFGPGPVRLGDLIIGNDLRQPVTGVATYGMAHRDPTWNVLREVQSQYNPKNASKLKNSGRMVRTHTFELREGTVHYLVKGFGHAWAVVDSHRMISGPLHGNTLLDIKSKGQLRWISHDLKRYKGHRIHIEFSAIDAEPLEILMVAQDHSGGDPVAFQRAILSPPNVPLGDLLTNPRAARVVGLARGYQDLMKNTIDRLASGTLGQGPEAPGYAAVADWMIRHPELFHIKGAPETLSLKRATRAFSDRRAKIAAKIKRDSRLALSMMDGSPENEYVFIRGKHTMRGETVPRRFLTALNGTPPRGNKGSGRMDLARQIVDPENPFISRVIVNRIWHHLFGRGIVPSVDNFGVLGQRPSHPELLDHLAIRFMDDGWSIKRHIKLVLMSMTYQMSSRAEGPDNHWLPRMRVRRLQGEVIRDAILKISGRLDTTMYETIPIWLSPFAEGRGRPKTGPLDGKGRRSIYLSVRRNFLSSMMLAFDMPIPFNSMGRRNVSNTPAQALILMNDPLIVQQCELWAKKILSQPRSDRDRVRRMYEEAFSRPPSSTELADALQFIAEMTKLSDGNRERPWADLGHVLFNAKEFIYLR